MGNRPSPAIQPAAGGRAALRCPVAAAVRGRLSPLPAPQRRPHADRAPALATRSPHPALPERLKRSHGTKAPLAWADGPGKRGSEIHKPGGARCAGRRSHLGAFTEGQPTAWLLLGATMIVLALRSDTPALAAGAGMLLAVKPQYLPVYLAILFAARRWRSLGAAATGGAIILLSPLGGGAGGLSAMVHNALSANQAVAIRLNES